MTEIDRIIKAANFFATTISREMQEKFGQPLLRCPECNKVQFGSWSYLKTGWPKHHGQTMRLESTPTPGAE